MKIRRIVLVLFISILASSGCSNNTPSKENIASETSIVDKLTIHSGVEFGMSIEEIERLETEAGFRVHRWEPQDYQAFDGEDKEYLSLAGKIASIEHSTIDYHFVDSKMNMAEYSFSTKPKDIFENEYDTIQNSLVEKYGNPTESLENIYSSKYSKYLNATFIPGKGIHRADHWFIQTQDGYIAIDHYSLYTTLSESQKEDTFFKDFLDGILYDHYLVYQKYGMDDPEITNALNTIEENEKQLINDL